MTKAYKSSQNTISIFIGVSSKNKYLYSISSRPFIALAKTALRTSRYIKYACRRGSLLRKEEFSVKL